MTTDVKSAILKIELIIFFNVLFLFLKTKNRQKVVQKH